MCIEVSETQISVREAEALTAFSVRTQLDADQLAMQFRTIDQGAWGYVDDTGYAWVNRAAIERSVESTETGPQWTADFGAMVAYAQSRGWVSPDGDAIRAHVE